MLFVAALFSNTNTHNASPEPEQVIMWKHGNRTLVEAQHSPQKRFGFWNFVSLRKGGGRVQRRADDHRERISGRHLFNEAGEWKIEVSEAV